MQKLEEKQRQWFQPTCYSQTLGPWAITQALIKNTDFSISFRLVSSEGGSQSPVSPNITDSPQPGPLQSFRFRICILNVSPGDKNAAPSGPCFENHRPGASDKWSPSSHIPSLTRPPQAGWILPPSVLACKWKWPPVQLFITPGWNDLIKHQPAPSVICAGVAVSLWVLDPNGNAGMVWVIVKSYLVYKSRTWGLVKSQFGMVPMIVSSKQWWRMVVVGCISPISLPWAVCVEDHFTPQLVSSSRRWSVLVNILLISKQLLSTSEVLSPLLGMVNSQMNRPSP